MIEVTEAKPIILFDGVCNLCAGSVQFIVRRDRGQFLFASLQSKVGRDLMSAHGMPANFLDGVVLFDGRGVWTHSTAALRIARGLRWPWRAFGVLLVLPRFLRDAVYRFIARNRYRWFGRTEECMLPTPELAARFVDDMDSPGDQRKLPVANQRVPLENLPK